MLGQLNLMDYLGIIYAKQGENQVISVLKFTEKSHHLTKSHIFELHQHVFYFQRGLIF
jgi:hypothetical protein